LSLLEPKRDASLVNVALAAGVLAGYFWRQNEIDALRNDLNRARPAALERGACNQESGR
jgi:hypothetical protein